MVLLTLNDRLRIVMNTPYLIQRVTGHFWRSFNSDPNRRAQIKKEKNMNFR